MTLFKSDEMPAWMKGKRDEAWKAALTLPLPLGTEERWRRSPPEDFDPSQYVTRLQDKSLPTTLNGSASRELMAELSEISSQGFVYASSGNFLERMGTDTSLPQGVEVLRLGEAAAQYPEVIRGFFDGKDDLFAGSKFAAFHKAMSHEFIVVKVADDIKVEKPVALFHRLPGDCPALVTTLVVLGRGSELTFVEDHDVQGAGGQFLTHILCGEGSNLQYLYFQGGKPKGHVLSHLHVDLMSRAKVAGHTIFSSGRKVRALATIHLKGPEAQSNLRGVVIGGDRQHFDMEPRQIHESGMTKSDMLFKMLLTGRARSVFQGDITMRSGAQKCEAYQINRNLLLSKTARVDTLPKLHIIPDNVKCKHGAATASVDEKQLYYLMSRGFDRNQAIELILQGFLAEIVSDFPEGTVRDFYEQKLATAAREIVAEVGG